MHIVVGTLVFDIAVYCLILGVDKDCPSRLVKLSFAFVGGLLVPVGLAMFNGMLGTW